MVSRAGLSGDRLLSAPTAIEVRGISKAFRIPHERRDTVREHFLHPTKRTTYEANAVLREISFSIKRGERFGVVGRNGTGKTTLSRKLSQLLRSDSELIMVMILNPIYESEKQFLADLVERFKISSVTASGDHPTIMDYLKAVEGTLSEWASAEDEAAYRDL